MIRAPPTNCGGPNGSLRKEDAQQRAVDRQHVVKRRCFARPHPAHPFVPGQVGHDRSEDADVDGGQHHREAERRRSRPPLQRRGRPQQRQAEPRGQRRGGQRRTCAGDDPAHHGVDAPGQHRGQHQQVARVETLVRQCRQRASADDQRHTGQRDHRADGLPAAEALMQGQRGQDADHQRAGPVDQRSIGGGGGAQAGVQQAAEAEHARHAHTEQERPFPAGPALGGRAAQQQRGEDDAGDGEARRGQGERPDVVAQQPAQGEVGGPEQGA